ncbi:MAG: acyl-CoA dehydrogenase family protein, partial [Acidimicrobiales bacterium]|nr:acyl-CoA dehydrogenase family protein [Acidimicrobiales bacterium]
WLAAHVGPYRAEEPTLPFADAGDRGHLERGRAWQRELHDGGWAGLGWPAEHGGRDLSVPLQAVWAEELAIAGAPPPVNLIGEAVAGPAILAHGTDDHRRRYLPPILDAGEIWCQLFSEPDAGSDLAAVAATATSCDGGWTVDGHKTWSSGAHHADRGLLLARTDPDVPKHQGLTCFLLDMLGPGVTVRPVRQMTGASAFDDVILEGARVDDADRLGPAGGGWAVAMTALASERAQLGLGLARAGAGVDRLLAELRPCDDPILRQLAAQLVVDARVAQLLGRRQGPSGPLSGWQGQGPEAAVAKLASARVSRRYDELVDAMRGAGSMLTDHHTLRQLWLPATRIAGGTDEVLKNVIAERVLGLPKGS